MTGNDHNRIIQAEVNHVYPDEVELLTIDGREIYLVGTAHISQGSVDLVKRLIATESQ